MKSKITSCINNFAKWTVIIILLVISCFLTITSFLYHFEEHTSSVLFDNIFTSLLAIAIFLALVLLLSRLLNPVYKLFSHIDKILLVITLLWVCCFSYFFVIGAKTLPCSDAKSVYDIAVRMYNGDIGAVVPTGSYLSLWPFQTGLIFIFEKLMRIFHTTEPAMLQYWNIFYIVLAVLSGYGFIRTITNRLEAIISYLLLAGIHQSIVYALSLLAFIHLALIKKREKHLEMQHYILAITVIGGFLFSIIWEGGSRYPLPYFSF